MKKFIIIAGIIGTLFFFLMFFLRVCNVDYDSQGIKIKQGVE